MYSYLTFITYNLNKSKMNKDTNALNWFEIPALDIDRAKKFYESIFKIEMSPMDEMMGMQMSGFPADPGNGKASGALVKSDMHIPSMDGCSIYLNANPVLQEVADRIEEAGGKILMPRTEISPEIGVMAIFIDSEGNKMFLHAQS